MKIKDGICGLIVGDALGVPVEFEPPENLEKNPVTGMRSCGSHKQPAGTWSDDSAMTLATIASICNEKTVDYDNIMHEFCNWYDNAEYMQVDKVFDYGIRTEKSILNYKNGTEALKCGGDSEYDNGNGSLMRILPLAFIANC